MPDQDRRTPSSNGGADACWPPGDNQPALHRRHQALCRWVPAAERNCKPAKPSMPITAASKRARPCWLNHNVEWLAEDSRFPQASRPIADGREHVQSTTVRPHVNALLHCIGRSAGGDLLPTPCVAIWPHRKPLALGAGCHLPRVTTHACATATGRDNMGSRATYGDEPAAFRQAGQEP